jgi:hypothetical protein
MDWKVCVAFGDQLQITLPHPGFVDHSTDGLFTPDLPRNDGKNGPILPAGVVGTYSPVVQSGEVVIGYFDDTDKRLIVATVTIQPKCP